MRQTAFQHPFDTATALLAHGDGRFTGQTSSDYANMVGPFGGITAATMLRAVLADPRHLGEPISLTVNYAGPIADGEFSIDVQPARTNRRTQHWTITLSQNDVVTTTGTAVFGTRQPTWSDTEVSAPAAPPAESISPTTFDGFVAWTGNYDMRFVDEGGLDLNAGAKSTSTSTMWLSDKPARPLDHPSLAAMSDAFFPRVMIRLGRFIPAGTISLTINFHAPTAQLAPLGDRPVLATIHAHTFGAGFSEQNTQLWSDDGALLVTSHQLMYFKDDTTL